MKGSNFPDVIISNVNENTTYLIDADGELIERLSASPGLLTLCALPLCMQEHAMSIPWMVSLSMQLLGMGYFE